MRNVSINLKKKENIIKIEQDAKQKDIIKELNTKLPDLKKLYKDEKVPIRVTGKTLKNSEMEEIEALIKKYLDISVNFDLPKELGLSGIVKTYSQAIKTSDTRFYKGSIRSGRKIEAEGSVVILGDVNSGAEIIATENIVVLGALRGLAHAGAKGNKEAVISAGSFDAVQIRIANIIREISKNAEIERTQTYIHVVNDQIVIDKC